MLWLAGLLGIIGVSAASFVIYQPEEEPDENTLDDDGSNTSGDDPLREVFSIEHDNVDAENSLGLDGLGNLFSLSPDAKSADDTEYPLNKEDYLFGQSVEDSIYSELTRPTLPDIEDMPEPLDVLGQDKHLFADQLPIDKPPLFTEQDNTTDQQGYRQNPLSGALGKDVLNKIEPDPQSNTLEQNEQQTQQDPAYDLINLEQSIPTDGPVMMRDAWLLQGETAEIVDYEAGQDSLVAVWDDLDKQIKEPTIHVVTDPFDDDVKHVLMNGRSLAEVYGDPHLNVSDVTLIPLSSALIIGLEPT